MDETNNDEIETGSENDSCYEHASVQDPLERSTEEIVQIVEPHTQTRVRGVKRKEAISALDLDESDLFYLSMSRAAKQLHKIEQAQIRLNICKQITEAQIRESKKAETSGS